MYPSNAERYSIYDYIHVQLAKLHTDTLGCYKCIAQRDGRLEVRGEVVDSRLEEDQRCEGYG